MGKNGNRPATPAQIERIKASVKGALAQVYLNLMLDCAFRKALSVTDAVSVLSDQDKEYAKKIVTLHANISDSLICLSVMLLCNFRTEEPIEKKFLLRRVVVVCHELYKYLYGFTKSQTDWEKIVPEFEKKYLEECDSLKKQGEKYLKKYGQAEDRMLRNVSNHYSDNPFEFFKYISTINEKGITDRALLMLAIAQTLNSLLYKELGDMLPKVDSAEPLSISLGECQFRDVLNDELTEAARQHLNHRKEIVRTQVQRLKKCEAFASQHGYDMTKDERWRLLKDDNIGLHVMYLQLDSMVLTLAMSRAESALEEKMILAYMVASMHEGFKKIYGFAEGGSEKSLWHRYAVSRQERITDSKLKSEISLVSGVLDAFAKQDYLKNPTVALFLSHVGYVKDLNGDTSNAMADYLLKDDHREEMAGVIKILSFLNVLVEVSGKLLSYENDVMSEEKKRELERHLNEIDEIERKAMLRISSVRDRQELMAQTEVMKDAIRKLYNWE